MSGERILIARAGAEHFGFPLADVFEAIDGTEVTGVPLVPSGVLGQCVHRGVLLPVLDPGTLLGAALTAAVGAGEGTVLVLVAEEPFALAMDDVADMITVLPAARRALPPGADRGGLLEGLVAHEGQLVGLVSPRALRAAARSVLSTHPT